MHTGKTPIIDQHSIRKGNIRVPQKCHKRDVTAVSRARGSHYREPRRGPAGVHGRPAGSLWHIQRHDGQVAHHDGRRYPRGHPPPGARGGRRATQRLSSAASS